MWEGESLETVHRSNYLTYVYLCGYGVARKFYSFTCLSALSFSAFLRIDQIENIWKHVHLRQKIVSIWEPLSFQVLATYIRVQIPSAYQAGNFDLGKVDTRQRPRWKTIGAIDILHLCILEIDSTEMENYVSKCVIDTVLFILFWSWSRKLEEIRHNVIWTFLGTKISVLQRHAVPLRPWKIAKKVLYS